MAVKVFDRRFRKQNSVREYQNLREELTIMTHLSHPRVISLVGVCLRPLCMVMKMAPQVEDYYLIWSSQLIPRPPLAPGSYPGLP